MAELAAHHAPFAHAYREAGWWIAGPAPDHLRQAAGRHPDRVALTDRQGAMTYAELDAAVRRMAAGLLAAGIGTGDAVAIQLPNRREFAIVQQAAVRIGAVYVPLLPQLRSGDLEPLLQACGARVLVTCGLWRGFDHAPMAAELLGAVGSLALALVVDAGPDHPETVTPFEDFLDTPWEAGHGAAVDAAVVDADAVRALLFTSGTESRPKGVLNSFNTLFFGLNRQIEAFGFSGEDTVLCASPVGHGTGAVNGVEFALEIGGKVALLDAWTPEAGLELIETERCTLMWGAATFFTDLSRAAASTSHDLSSFHLALTAGAPVPRELVGAVRDSLGATLIAAYGQSEGQNIAINGPDDPLERITGSDGRVHGAIAFKLVDAERQPVAEGEAGEFAYRGPNVCLGFLDPAHTAAAFDAEGYLYSGDLAVVDPDRYLRIVGRRKDIIIRGGENISPAEVEDLLFGHPAIREVAVVGYDDPRMGQRACAVVVPAEGARPGVPDLVAWLAERRVAKFKYPERVVLVDALPRTDSGKVQKDILRRTISAEVVS